MIKKWAMILTVMTVLGLLLAACSGGQGGQAADGKAVVQADGAKSLVIAVPVASSFLKEAVQKFEMLHPDIHVEIQEYFEAMKSKQNVTLLEVEKYIQSMTTQIMSGKASDIISTDFLPKDKFAKKQAFADIQEMLRQDSAFQPQDYYLLPSASSGDGQYIMPISFTPSGFVQGNKQLMEQAGITIDDSKWTWSEIGELSGKLKAKAGQKFYAFLNIAPDFLLTGDLKQYYRNGEARFDSDEFRHTMEQIKSLYDEKAIGMEDAGNDGKGLSNSLFSLADMSGPLNALVSYLNPDTAIYRKPSFAGTGGHGGTVYEMWEAYAINNKSAVKNEAWMFLKFMLSEEMQTSTELQGFPLNKAATAQKLQQARQQIVKWDGKQDSQAADVPLPLSFPLPDAQAFEQGIKKVQSALETVIYSGYGSVDLDLVNIVSQEFAYYMNGQKSAEEISKLIQNRAMTYLNE